MRFINKISSNNSKNEHKTINFVLFKKRKSMKIEYIERNKTGGFSKNANRLLDQTNNDVSSFINRSCELSNYKAQIEEKSKHFTTEKRTLLSEQLQSLYTEAGLLNEKRTSLIKSIENEKTFTVTTGHQLSLFTGPLYFIYKIFHVIKLTESLKKKFPEYNFVPLFWMASEDHDFEEIQSIKLFNHDYSWNSDQIGAVGRFQLNEIKEFKDQLSERFANDDEILELINESYDSKNKLSVATFKLVYRLFSNHDLLILDGDNAALKKSFYAILEKELTTHFSNDAVEKTNIELEKRNFKKQIHSRKINLFYIDENNHRERIVVEDNAFQVGEKKFSKDQLLEELKLHPERFSPNVVLRPLYQEYILPNLAYIGGGGEISYWLQLKGVFDEAAVPYPIIQVRNSIQIIEKSVQKKMEKLDFSVQDIFKPTDELKKYYLLNKASEELDFLDLDGIVDNLSKNLESSIIKVDGGLKGYAQSEIARFNKQISGVKQKLIRQKKKQEEDAMNQIENIHERLFPDGALQERKLNVLQFFVKHGIDSFMDQIYEATNPEENRLIVLKED